MRIYSWNINGVRAAATKGLGQWLARCDGDVVGLQEVRALPDQVPPEIGAATGWTTWFVAAERKGYSGVGLLTRQAPDHQSSSLERPEFDVEGRVQMARFGALTVVNVYFPNGNGKERDNSRVSYKLDFYRRLWELLEDDKQRGQRILVMGDFNTAHTAIDLARPKENEKISGFLPVEREEFSRWIDSGWVDTFRAFHPEGGHYTWWSQRFGVREKNVGWRIDYVLASPGAMEFVTGAAIHPSVQGSDHCPISVDLAEAVRK